jgi:hypothetical protein
MTTSNLRKQSIEMEQPPTEELSVQQKKIVRIRLGNAPFSAAAFSDSLEL